jgi:hypothetical protein
MTTHNTTVIAELDATNLHVTRRSDEEVRIFPVDQGLQDVVRGASEALLNKKVIICEGPTEVGLMRSLDKCWQTADVYLSIFGNSFHRCREATHLNTLRN